MKRVMVTGATGFIGHYIVKQLLESGYQVSVLVRPDSKNLNTLKPFEGQIRIFQSDLHNIELLEQACADQDIVVHASAIVSFENSRYSELIKTNVEGTANLINVCLELKTPHFIHISSIAALGGLPGQTELDESANWTDKKHTNPYSLSKHLAELEVWRGAAEGLDITILNPSLVIGVWDAGHHSMQLFKTINSKWPFYPSGSNGFVDVKDVAQAVIQSIDKKPVQERVIINGYNISYRDMLNQIASIKGIAGPSRLFPKTLALLGGSLIRFGALITGRKHYFQSSLLNSVYTKSSYNNKKSIEKLDMIYRPIEQTLTEVIHSINQRN